MRSNAPTAPQASFSGARSRNDGIVISAIITAVFAAIWFAMGVRSLDERLAWVLTGVGAIISIIIVLATISRSRSAQSSGAQAPPMFEPVSYGISVALMLIAIPLVSSWLRQTGHDDATMPAIAVIVGIHFFGLVWAFGLNRFWLIGGIMCGVAIATMLLLPPTLAWNAASSGQLALWDLCVGVGCAVTLWSALILAPRTPTHQVERNLS
jgi:hypothetical protein